MVGLGVKIYDRSNFTFKLTLSFTLAFLLVVITGVALKLGS